jgi:hypothetical protein
VYIPEAELPTTVRASLGARLRRERMLGSPGEILVTLNQQVEPSTVVAVGSRASGVQVVDLATTLGLSGRKLADALQVEPGQYVEADQPLAAVKRLTGTREAKAPAPGMVLAVDEQGHLLLGTGAQHVQLIAGLRGVVTSIMGQQGVVVEGNAGLIQGVWGNGVEARYGVIRLVVTNPAEEIVPERIDASTRDTILVLGATIDEPGLQRAAAARIRGMIVGGLPASLRELACQMTFPIMVTEGFGTCPIAGDLFDVMGQANGREVVLDGSYQTRFGRQLPELIIPRTHNFEPLGELRGLQEGQLVRIVSLPNYGATGLITKLDAGRQRMETGITMPGCEIRLASGETLFAPYTNLERIG